MGKIYKSITELVGHTPLVELGNYEKKHNLKARLLGKLEYFNPSGSIKDRAALNMIEEAEKAGLCREKSIKAKAVSKRKNLSCSGR